MNNFLLIAFTPSDGWAVLQEGERHWLVQPPYRDQDWDLMSDLQVARMLAEWDSQLEYITFLNREDVKLHLEGFRVRSASAADRAQAQGAAQRLLRHATAVQARRHLGRLREAVEQGQRRGVSEALKALLQAESVIADPGLAALANELRSLIETDNPEN